MLPEAARTVPSAAAISRSYMQWVSYSLLVLSVSVAAVAFLFFLTNINSEDVAVNSAALISILIGCSYAILMGFIARKKTPAAARIVQPMNDVLLFLSMLATPLVPVMSLVLIFSLAIRFALLRAIKLSQPQIAEPPEPADAPGYRTIAYRAGAWLSNLVPMSRPDTLRVSGRAESHMESASQDRLEDIHVPDTVKGDDVIPPEFADDHDGTGSEFDSFLRGISG